MLFLRLHDEDPYLAREWLLTGRDGEVINRGGETALPVLAQQCGEARACVLVPSHEVRLTEVALPSRRRRQALAALPYNIEDELAEDVDQCHIAHRLVGAGAGALVAVVARDRMDEWLTSLTGAGIRAAVMTPDLFLLPVPEQGWSLLLEGGRVLVRKANGTGFELEADNAAVVLAGGGDASEPLPVAVYADPDADDPSEPSLPAWLQTGALQPERAGRASDRLVAFAGGYRADSVINLLQGRYRQRERSAARWRVWRPAAALALFWLGLQSALTWTQIDAAVERREAVERETEEVFRQALPEVTRIQDVRAQAELTLEQLRGGGVGEGSELLPLLESAAPIVAGYPDATVTRMTFRDRRLTLDLTLPTLQSVEDLRGKLQSAGLNATVETAGTRDGVVSGRLQIRRGAG